MKLPGRRHTGHRPRGRRALWLAGAPLLTLALAGSVAVWPAVPAGPAAVTGRAPRTDTALGGSPAVGAMFSTSRGRLLTHFCTASVVDSPAGDLLVTAAHCVSGYSDISPVGLAFAPGFDNGKAPYGIWPVTRIFVDSAWSARADPDHDVAFLLVAQSGSDTEIQNVTGGERLGVGQPAAGPVRVIGYPNVRDQPISCQNRVSAFGASQLKFDCARFTDGTSGSPFLTDVDAATGEGTVIGVIGGYQLGGSLASVSYSAAFGAAVQRLYDTAAAQALRSR
jgi:V8-like Glu-specific endopeptidase